MRISDWSSDVCSSDLQADQHQNQRDDPETDDDLRLGPALQLIVMMQWRHAEDAFATAVFEIADLQCDRYRLGDEDAAHDHQHDFLPDQHGDNDEYGPERERERKSVV